MIQLDTDMFYWINQHHCAFADWMLWCASQHWSWAIVLLFFFFIGPMRYEPEKWWIVLIGIALCFLLSDRISVSCFKNVFCRLRPCHALPDVRLFRTSCGGMYGFVSSHAANVGALAIFLILRMRMAAKKYLISKSASKPRWALSFPSFTVLVAIWMMVVCYSRPYLGKHYPGDVICGAAVGMLLGTIVFLLIYLFENSHVINICKKK